jgi:hypothetical protein
MRPDIAAAGMVVDQRAERPSAIASSVDFRVVKLRDMAGSFGLGWDHPHLPIGFAATLHGF